MTELLANFAAGRWQTGNGPGTVLSDPVLGDALVRVDCTGLDLPEAFAFARDRGGAALRAMTYRERAALLAAVVKVLQAHRESYYDIATANSGTVKNDSAVDIDGGIFTLGQYARWGDALGDVRVLRDGDAVKPGQKCTAIRRILVPAAVYDAAAEAIGAKLAGISVGNPRNESVRMGSLVSAAQLHAVREGLAALSAHTDLLHDGRARPLVDADPAVAACMGPVLLGARDADAASAVHDMEVFGPVATLLPYRDLDHALALAHRGQGSLVTSLFGADEAALAAAAVQLAASHWRVHVVTPDVAQAHTGHGNVMPMSQHGGPGRAGGGAELGGLRALDFYHQRSAVQASPGVLASLGL